MKLKRMLSVFAVMIMAIVLVACDKKDTVVPEIKGTKDYTIAIGDAAPDYLNGVTVTDDTDTDIKATVDATSVDLTKEGKYTIIFEAEDKAGNKTIDIKTVTVINKDIIEIKGTKDFKFTVGDEMPDFYEGVTATDLKGNEYFVIVDSYAVRENQSGEYSIYYKAVNDDSDVLAIKEQKVIVEHKQEIKEIAEFIQGLDFSTIGNQNTKLSLSVLIPEIILPDQVQEGVPVVVKSKIENLDIKVNAYANLSTYENSVVMISIEVNIGEMSSKFMMGEQVVAEFPTFKDDYLVQNIYIKDGKLYNYTDISEGLLDFANTYIKPSATQPMIPDEYQSIFREVLRLAQDYKEVQNNAYTETTHTEVTGILNMITTMVPYLITDNMIYQSPFDIKLDKSVLTLSELKPIVVPDLLSFIPIKELNLPIFDLIGITNFGITLDGADNKFNALNITATYKDIAISLELTTKDVTLPELPVFEDAKEVETITLISVIKNLLNAKPEAKKE